ncbi:hypothetical protein H8356DRAFT_1040720 [Neocallimastix lanati (nom. inval.)]|jgi:hypothetical protein|uniref:Tetraspanin Tsp2 n=1 Tax=Neocallimastix californiae TaxID=1754190 RepID=A0A1Y2E647_9FUNG|nr:hypothetical protein H8356DRAFT_1040720 [Neocallimastix sp. JGI-2020a]ORY66756.1 hypothetical protein LY90DRAFT_667920 [Neocallimastix californiae]|eukprot:ORY66756.1 hypothetical protein LY90DRAFT_667920 [Neocallimastix californiae]
MDPKEKLKSSNGIELNMYRNENYNVQDEDFISIEPDDNNSTTELNYNLLDNNDSESEEFNFSYEGILKSPFKLPKRRNKHKKRRNKYIDTQSEYDDLNELLIDDDDETYNNYSRVPTYQESDDETLDNDAPDNLSNSDLYLLNQEEIPYLNLWSSFSNIFIKSVLRSTKRYNTYEKEIRRNFLISLLAVIATSTVYLIIALYAWLMDGYSQKNIHDIDGNTERAIIFASVFLIFTASLGLIGIRYKFKPMIILYILMNILSFSFQYFSIKQIHNIVVNVERNMAFAWWDTYTIDIKKNIQSQFNCCGYLDYMDNAISMDICPEKIVHKKVKFETIGPIPVRVKKNRFNKTFTIPDVGDMNQYFTKEEMKHFQVKLKESKQKSNKNNNEHGKAMKDIGIDLDLDLIEEKNKNNAEDLNRRNIDANTIPGGCYKEINRKVVGSLSLLCIFCWILSISSPFALVFSLLYCKNLDMKKKSCEYF